MQVEVLIGAMSSRGRAMLTSLVESARRAGVNVERTDQYRGSRPTLVTYGLGDPARFAAFKRHRIAGGQTIICDLGYWHRKAARKIDCLQRFAVDGMHCDNLLYRAAPSPDRLRQYGLLAREMYDPDGPIVLVGQGPKGNLNSGYERCVWERKALAVARERWPNKRVWYRPKVKAGNFTPLPEADSVKPDGPIIDVLGGASLVMCQHSNVGVDAIVAGVPVLAEAGAACALHGYGLDQEPQVVPIEERQRFLDHLAAWQWTPTEASQGLVWSFLMEALSWTQENLISA